METTNVSQSVGEKVIHRIRWPEPSFIAILLSVPLLYHLKTIAMPILLADFARVFPDLVPSPFRTIVTVLFWVLVGGTVLLFVGQRALTYSEPFESIDDLESTLANELPSRYVYVGYALVATAGVALAWWSYDPFVATFEAFVDLAVVRAGGITFGVGLPSVLRAIAFVAGYVLAAGAVDRVLIGLVRTASLKWNAPTRRKSGPDGEANDYEVS